MAVDYGETSPEKIIEYVLIFPPKMVYTYNNVKINIKGRLDEET